MLDLGRPPLARFPSGDKKLSTVVVTKEDLDYAIDQVGGRGGGGLMEGKGPMLNYWGTAIVFACLSNFDLSLPPDW